MKRYGLGLGLFAAIGFAAFAGCSVETKASDIICVPDQSNVCTDCKKDPTDTASYAGRHVCAHDGKSFGPCEQCVPQVDKNDFQPVSHDDDPDGGGFTPTGDAIDPVCANKLGLLAGKDDAADQFVYAAVFDGRTFKAFSTSGTPMRSPAAAAPNGASMLVVYRTKSDSLISTSFGGGLWTGTTTIAGATTNGAPALTSWGGEIKAVFRQDDGYHHVATFVPGTGWKDGVERIGSSSTPPPPGISDPSVVSTGTPGLPGAGIMVGYTDNAKGLYRNEWRGEAWFPKGIKATTVEAAAYRPNIIAMTSGDFDLLSMYVNADGELHVSTRTSKDNGSVWSADALTTDKARPTEAVNGVGLDDGRALVVYRDAGQQGLYMVFDPKKTPAWSDPRPLFESANPVLASAPQVVRDPCGAEAAMAIATDKGVAVVRFAGDAWKGPYPVQGIPAATYATVVATP